MEHIFKVVDFNIYNEKKINTDEDEDDVEIIQVNENSSNFMIQIFGLNELGKTCSIIVEDFKPFFYILVNDTWNIQKKDSFLQHLKTKMGKYYENSVSNCIIIKRKKFLYI